MLIKADTGMAFGNFLVFWRCKGAYVSETKINGVTNRTADIPEMLNVSLASCRTHPS